ncbi:mitochondrial processing peptidase beta subunit [Perkinsus olseni]|uniref:Mitochondrial processing peptidase beta subunit n=1 Tax=Perkinsus olseni TaxID=32597 RepID=A0A7J6LST8_PEROL|nr:mitochondrial processing peptidase beta subunit [Perkinsus olseni]
MPTSCTAITATRPATPPLRHTTPFEIIPEFTLTPRRLQLAGVGLGLLGVLLAIITVVPSLVWLCLLISTVGAIVLVVGVWLEVSESGGSGSIVMSNTVREILTEKTLLEILEVVLKRSTMGFMMAGLLSLKFFDLNELERARFLAGCSPRIRHLLTTRGLASLLPSWIRSFLPKDTPRRMALPNSSSGQQQATSRDEDSVHLALACIKRHPRSLSPRLRLEVSALCRQTLHGDAPLHHPPVTKPAQALAWLAWDNCRGLSKQEARARMIDILMRFDEDFANLSYQRYRLHGGRPTNSSLVEVDRFGKPKIFPIVASIVERYLRRYVSESWAPWCRRRLIVIVTVLLLCSLLLRTSPRVRRLYDRAPKAVLLFSSALIYLLSVQHGVPGWAFAMCPDFALRMIFGGSRGPRGPSGGWQKIFDVFVNEALPFVREDEDEGDDDMRKMIPNLFHGERADFGKVEEMTARFKRHWRSYDDVNLVVEGFRTLARLHAGHRPMDGALAKDLLLFIRRNLDRVEDLGSIMYALSICVNRNKVLNCDVDQVELIKIRDELIGRIIRRMRGRTAHMLVTERVQLLNALAKLENTEYQPLFHELMRTVLESYQSCIGNDLAMANCNFYNSSVYVITAAAKAGLVNKELFDLIANQCIDGFDYVPYLALSHLLNGLGELSSCGYSFERWPDLFGKTASILEPHEMLESTSLVPPAAIMRMLKGLTLATISGQLEDSERVREVVTKALGNLAETVAEHEALAWDSHSVPDLAFVMAHFQLSNDSLIELVTAYCTDKAMVDWPVVHLVTTLKYGVRLPPSDAVEAWLDRILSHTLYSCRYCDPPTLMTLIECLVHLYQQEDLLPTLKRDDRCRRISLACSRELVRWMQYFTAPDALHCLAMLRTLERRLPNLTLQEWLEPTIREFIRQGKTATRPLAQSRRTYYWGSTITNEMHNVAPTQVTRLANGMRVATQFSYTDSATVGLWIDAGARYETKESNGTAHFLERVLYKGTKNRTRNQLETEVENIGANLNSYTGREQTAFYAKTTKDGIFPCIDVLADSILNPSLDADEIEKERILITQDLQAVNQSYEELLYDKVHTACYRDCSLGQTVIGPEENVATIKRDHMINYLYNNFTADRMVLVAVGPVDHGEIVKEAEKKFANIRPTAGPRMLEEKPYFCASELVYRNDDMGPTAHIAIAYEGVPWRSPDHITFMLMNSIFGSYDKKNEGLVPGLQSANRITQTGATRMDVGCFDYYTGFNISYKDTGLFGFYIATDEVAVEHAVGDLMFGVTSFSYSLTEEEVMKAKRELKTNFFSGLDNTTGVAEDIGRQILAYGRRLSPAEFVERLDQIDSQEVQRVAWNRLHDAEITMTGVGPLHGLLQLWDLRRQTWWWRY